MIRLDHQSPLMGSLQSKSGVEDIGFRDLELRVQQAIERLPPRCKVIFQLSRQEDMSHKQIAEALNLSVKTIENQMSIALAKLRKELRSFLTPEFFLLLAALAYIATTLFRP
jgi:RNA polymerase sigma-70 factor (ECF subfamily)